MKHFSRLLSSCAVGLFCALAAAQAQQINVNKQNRSIAVQATAEAHAEADRARVHIGFLVYGADEKSAYAAGAKTSQAIVAALTEANVPKDAIESVNQAIARVNAYAPPDWTAEEKAERKFQLEQSWIVTCPAKDAARILGAAITAGANQSGQIDWSVADENALATQAAELALARAKQIAGQMAKGLGAALGPLLYAGNQLPSHVVVPRMKAEMMSATARSAEQPQPLSIRPPRIIKSASVYAVFAIQ